MTLRWRRARCSCPIRWEDVRAEDYDGLIRSPPRRAQPGPLDGQVLWGKQTTALPFEQQEVTRLLAQSSDFVDVPPGSEDYSKKTSGLHRDTLTDWSPSFVVVDGNYVSARWPGDVYKFAATFCSLFK
eukprot:TRINITY_DN13360_c0_g1_i6.p1 TRINITY_DN13360_c0_g1~~TRINITY_DN13360_c0_g1_i6.p1  ORF type:complete len:144 (-),score=9.88 TRINITY_DN13360_c0_g1_i6:47-430(-)